MFHRRNPSGDLARILQSHPPPLKKKHSQSNLLERGESRRHAEARSTTKAFGLLQPIQVLSITLFGLITIGAVIAIFGESSDTMRRLEREMASEVAVLQRGIVNEMVALESQIENEIEYLDGTYHCPTEPITKDAPNYDKTRFENAYLKGVSHTLDFKDFLENFRELPYDDWQHTYNHMKHGMTPWKAQYIAKNVRNGDMLYESASGLGLNTLMTLEIIQEMNGPQQLTVYGNEYLESNAERANQLLDHVLPEGLKKGNVCVGDSTNLDFVPSNMFDLVWTGSIVPLANPLHFHQPGKSAWEINHGHYNEICNSPDWRDQQLLEIEQIRQKDFYATWVGEMIRITKPGKPIIIEQVSQPKCMELADWGGVEKTWWTFAIRKYNWPIDPNSLEIEDDHIFNMKRYHVFMRKLAKNSY